MAPSATVVFPTRARRDYLAVALASVAPQAADHGAEVIVVEDDPEQAETRALAEAHAARYVAHGDTRGLNAARNTGIAHARSDLIAFLDDDVEVWPGWLAALLEGAAANPLHGVLGGPIRARLEGTNLHACGREAPPITALDLGPRDRDADFAWGANFTVRRSAIEQHGGFDPGLDLYGDEEDWQRRFRSRGGRIRYLAQAGVDHRRTGADARIAGLSRSAFHRGKHSRRYDMRKGTSPTLARELRVLLGSALHVFRYRCGNGIVLTAHTAGRIAEALAPARPSLAGQPEWVSGESGTLNRRSALIGMARDAVTEVAFLPRRLALLRAATSLSPRRVLAVSIARPERAGTAAAAGQELERSRHGVAFRLAPVHPGAGKWQNLNRALEGVDLRAYDWLLIVDDDVVLPRRFLDPFLFLCERYGFTLAQPAHKHWSNAAWRVTRRRAGTVARRTRFVEIGPVTAVHARAFEALLPFPDLHMGWGLDAHWGAVAAAKGWPVGVVDATPIRHTRPVAGDYPRDRALAEAERFLAARPYITREEAQETVTAYRGWS
jgi:GT2 family glycosyltransferase